MEKLESKILQALARGWGHKENETKGVDPELASAMCEELKPVIKQWVLEIVGRVPFTVSDWQKFRQRVEEDTK